MTDPKHNSPTAVCSGQQALHTSAQKGKILRLKAGYNPNSSSIGSVVFLLSSKLLAFSASFGAAAWLIYSYFERKPTQSQPNTVLRKQDEEIE